jgi:hypothetical protein
MTRMRGDRLSYLDQNDCSNSLSSKPEDNQTRNNEDRLAA